MLKVIHIKWVNFKRWLILLSVVFKFPKINLNESNTVGSSKDVTGYGLRNPNSKTKTPIKPSERTCIMLLLYDKFSRGKTCQCHPLTWDIPYLSDPPLDLLPLNSILVMPWISRTICPGAWKFWLQPCLWLLLNILKLRQDLAKGRVFYPWVRTVERTLRARRCALWLRLGGCVHA